MALLGLITTFKRSTLYLVLRFHGSAKKRKKKSSITPKKNKHKRKKVKLKYRRWIKMAKLVVFVKNALLMNVVLEFLWLTTLTVITVPSVV